MTVQVDNESDSPLAAILEQFVTLNVGGLDYGALCRFQEFNRTFAQMEIPYADQYESNQIPTCRNTPRTIQKVIFYTTIHWGQFDLKPLRNDPGPRWAFFI